MKKDGKFLLIIVFMLFCQTIVFADTHYWEVTKATDGQVGHSDYEGTLRWALEMATTTPGEPDIILFLLSNVSFPYTMEILHGYLMLDDDDISIDGESQYTPGYSGLEPKIVISGFGFQVLRDNCEIKNLTISSATTEGIVITGNNNIITECVIINNNNGIRIDHGSYNTISNNNIGTTRALSTNNGNNWHGIFIEGNSTFHSSNNLIEQNVIVYNNLEGIKVYDASNSWVSVIQNKITQNKIYDNNTSSNYAIKLLSGGNIEYPPPGDVTLSSGIITGSSNNIGDKIEIFGSTAAQNANKYIDFVIADANKEWSFQVPLGEIWDYYTATTTDGNGNTSELSKPLPWIQIGVNHTEACHGIDLQFTADLSNIPAGATVEYTWDVGDGSPIISTDDDAFYICSFENNTSIIVEYTVIVTATLSTGQIAIDQMDIVIYPIPIISAAPVSIREGQSVHFDSDTQLPLISWDLYYYDVDAQMVIIDDGENVSSGQPVVDFDYTFLEAGDGEIEVFLDYNYGPVSCTGETIILVCSGDCIYPFAPKPNEEYVISAWVSEEMFSPPQITFTSPVILISFMLIDESTINLPTFVAKGPIIEGWQKIESEFTVPAEAIDITVSLLNAYPLIDAYFDDIRIFPVNGSMKSYVYDPVNLRFIAELDENNYATFYEYDQEGKLTRIKKETEKGIVTLKESRSNMSKVR
ncbi:MAG: right-handed parallel beta-helix repeat-containing protein [Bacteroidota bacterium]